jgi:hypothetical protein
MMLMPNRALPKFACPFTGAKITLRRSKTVQQPGREMYDLELEAQELEASAEWRRGKAQQYPEDTRNLEAAQLLDRLAVEIRALTGSETHRQLSATAEKCDDDFCSFSESWSEYKRRIGFWEFPDGQEYLSDMLKTMLSSWPSDEEIAN